MAKNWGPARRLMLVISFEGLAHRGRQGGPQPAIAVEQNQNAGRSRMHFTGWLASLFRSVSAKSIKTKEDPTCRLVPGIDKMCSRPPTYM